MKEPIYECASCGRDLPSHDIGQYIWCPGCRSAWGKGFEAGLRAASKAHDIATLEDMEQVVSSATPWRVIE